MPLLPQPVPLLPPRLLLHPQMALLPARFDGWNSSSPRLYHLSSLMQKEHHRYHHQNHHHLLSSAPLLPPPSQSPRRPSASPSPPPLCVYLSTERVNVNFYSNFLRCSLLLSKISPFLPFNSMHLLAAQSPKESRSRSDPSLFLYFFRNSKGDRFFCDVV